MKKIWLISNYNQDPSGLIDHIGVDYIVLNQGKTNQINWNIVDNKKCRTSYHSGHNISDYLEFIVENYGNLPESLGLVKGNLIPRHISKSLFEERIKQEGFVSYYGDESTYIPQKHKITRRFVAQQIAPGVYLETNNNWYVKTRCAGRFYTRLDDMYMELFGRKSPNYIPFIPGACMSVPKMDILKWGLDVYEHLYQVVTYDFFPVEAFHLERCLLTLWGFQKK